MHFATTVFSRLLLMLSTLFLVAAPASHGAPPRPNQATAPAAGATGSAAASSSEPQKTITIGPGQLPLDPVLHSYCQKLLMRVHGNWFRVMPAVAYMGDRGEVAIDFAIGRDGGIIGDIVIAEKGRAGRPLKDAAIKAVRESAPFEALPQQFNFATLRLRVLFFYNIKPDSPQSTQR